MMRVKREMTGFFRLQSAESRQNYLSRIITTSYADRKIATEAKNYLSFLIFFLSAMVFLPHRCKKL